MYVLSETPRTSSETFEALDNVFGGEEFSASDAVTVLEEGLDLDSGRARNELSRMLRSGAIEEV